MNLNRSFLPAVLLVCLAACGNNEPAGEQPSGETGTMTESRPAQTMPPVSASPPDSENDARIRHMHLHAEQLASLNAALAAGDLEAAGTPAYWLARHENFAGLPDGWQPHMAKMRAAATAVEEATGLEAARAGAKRIAEACAGCHKANNRDIALPGV